MLPYRHLREKWIRNFRKSPIFNYEENTINKSLARQLFYGTQNEKSSFPSGFSAIPHLTTSNHIRRFQQTTQEYFFILKTLAHKDSIDGDDPFSDIHNNIEFWFASKPARQLVLFELELPQLYARQIVLPDGYESDPLSKTSSLALRNQIKVLHEKDNKRKIIEELDTKIIDEVSMLQADVLQAIDYSLKVNGGDPSKSFGGKQILFVGDLFQLPPVANGGNEVEQFLFNELYKSPYFFDSDAYKEPASSPFNSQNHIYKIEKETWEHRRYKYDRNKSKVVSEVKGMSIKR